METVLVLPAVALVLLLLAQVALVVRDQVLVIHAAREGARAAAVDPDPAAARAAAAQSAPLDGDRLVVRASGRRGPGSRVEVEVRYESPTDLPLVGGLIGDVELRADASMRVER